MFGSLRYTIFISVWRSQILSIEECPRMLALLLVVGADCLVAPKNIVIGRGRRGALAASAADAFEAFERGQAATVAAVLTAIPDLGAKTDQSWLSEDKVTIAGKPALLGAYDAPGPANVAWISALGVESALSSLTVFNGPLTDVPHLVSRAVLTEDAIDLLIDWRPRAYLAYETRDPETGEFPPPASREAFMQGSGRKTFAEKFFTAELEAWVISTTFDGAVPNVDVSSLEALSRGPLTIDVKMPLTDENIAAVVAARAHAADLWLSWALDTAHKLQPGMKVTSTYAYDTKMRANLYGAGLGTFTQLYGESEGAALAAADAGPLDEAYVGGAS